MYIDEDIYFQASNLANNLVEKVSDYVNLPISRVNCMHIKKYVHEVEDVEFLDVRFDKCLGSLIVGSISKIYDEVLISINKDTMYERRWFTTMHETAHYYFDLSTLENGMSLSDMISEDDYLSEDLSREYRANVTASVLMANDVALVYAVSKFKSFQHLCNYFYMSKSAMQIRLIEYLVYHKNCTRQHAFSLVTNFRYSRGEKFRNAFF